jgi:NAD(P)-dependent dehydrogenase (short-subunit alcohol dehydrogenase family)
VADIKTKYPSSTGSLLAHQLDLSDLNSVRSFVSWYTGSHTSLDFLVNNAGINYDTLRQKSTPETPLCSPQGYDLTFASNYLGHFLLTDSLVSLLAAARPLGRVVQVSSNAHFQVNGSELLPPTLATPPLHKEDHPLAARCAVNDDLHAKHSYGNSKLAQVLHSVALQRELDSSADLTGLKVRVGQRSAILC